MGIQISRNVQEGTTTLTQTSLMNRALNVMGLEESNLKFTPPDKILLHKDEYGSPHYDLNYKTIAGMSLYLAGSTRLKITYAVH